MRTTRSHEGIRFCIPPLRLQSSRHAKPDIATIVLLGWKRPKMALIAGRTTKGLDTKSVQIATSVRLAGFVWPILRLVSRARHRKPTRPSVNLFFRLRSLGAIRCAEDRPGRTRLPIYDLPAPAIDSMGEAARIGERRAGSPEKSRSRLDSSGREPREIASSIRPRMVSWPDRSPPRGCSCSPRS